MITAGKRLVWKDYQKEIAEDKYFYARSCIRQNFFPGSEKAFTRILKDELGKDLCDSQHHTSCTGIGYHTDVVPLETTMTVVARQFSLMAEAGYENNVQKSQGSLRPTGHENVSARNGKQGEAQAQRESSTRESGLVNGEFAIKINNDGCRPQSIPPAQPTGGLAGKTSILPFG